MPKRVHTRTCVYCGKKYRTQNATETCSLACRSRLRTKRILEQSETKACPICGKVSSLIIRVYDIHVCSKRCKSIVASREWRKRHGDNVDVYGRIKSPQTLITCEVCGKEFTGKRYGQKYCSFQCKTVAMHSNARQRKQDLRKSSKTCTLCQIEFDKIPTPRELNFRSFGNRALDTKVHLDHIVCRVDNGQNRKDNLRPVCWMCNHIRGTMDIKFDSAIASASRAFWAEVLPVFSAITG